jgi:hypothetical protein
MHAKATADAADQDDAPAERGILFGVSMVRFILDGTKTQTRRVVSPQPYDRSTWSGRRPFGVPGDHLWVREMWRHDPDTGRIVYAADLDETQRLARRPWRPSLFMPRAASRITLEVQSIHMERLQSIREDDARAEGVPCVDGRYLGPPDVTGEAETFGTAVRAYAAWWSAANGPDAWDRNEWVWVIRFQRLVPR